MTDWPKISIVTPSFNQGKFLEKTILSVLEQDYPNLEYIIIDGGSTDNSVEIIKKYEQHLAYWVSEPDRGQSHAINKGFERATGEVFGWLNSDDWYHPGALKAVAEAFAANPEAGAVVGAGEYIDANGAVLAHTVPSQITLKNLYGWFDNYFWQPSCFIRKNVWWQCGPLDETLHVAMDLDLWIRVAKEYKFLCMNKVLSYALKHDMAKTTAGGHESDLVTLKVIAKHGGLDALDIVLAGYHKRLISQDYTQQNQISELRKQLESKEDELKQLERQYTDKHSPIANVVSLLSCIASKISSFKKGDFTLRKSILFVDYQVPHFDMFAGSKTNFLYLQLLIDLGLDVTFIASNFTAVEPYTSSLKKLGIKVLDGSYYEQNWKKWISNKANKFDYVLINKPEPANLFLEFIRENTNAKIIYQVHDLHFVRLQRKYFTDRDESTLIAAFKCEQIERRIISLSDVILTFSDTENQLITEMAPGKPVITVPLYFYNDHIKKDIDFSERRGLLFVGGFDHLPNKDAVLWFANQILPEIKKKIPNVILHCVGANPPDEIKALQSQHVNILGHISEEALDEMYERVRLVVIPLRFGAGVKGKVVEALHRGIPVVSTKIGIEGIADTSSIIELADSENDFANKVISLYDDFARLQLLSSKGQDLIAKQFTYNRAYNQFKNLLEV